MQNKHISLREFNWGLFASLCALALVPAVYQVVRTSIISASSAPEVFDILGQMEWYDLINETLRAFIIVPLYAVLNRILKHSPNDFAAWVFKTGIVALALYALFSAGVLVYGSVLVRAMNPAGIDVAVVSAYLGLENVAFVAEIVASFAAVVFVVIGRTMNVYVFLAARTVLTVAGDLVFIPRMGVYGVAVSNIIVNVLLAAVCVALLASGKHVAVSGFSRGDIPLLKEWAKVGAFSGCQQFIDNVFYAVMICKMVNMVAEQGNYWIANNFIWGWLLIPVGALGEIIRRDCKDGYRSLRQGNYYFITAAIVALWALTAPLWQGFYRNIEGLQNAEEIFLITARLMPFYVAYALCTVIDSMFIGLGKTQYIMINSLIVNAVYYGIFYVCYKTGAVTMTLDTILLMFGFGMVVHLFVSILEERCFLRKKADIF